MRRPPIEEIIDIEYGDGVYVNASTGYAGVYNPIGTAAHPVNNLADAITIATNRKLTRVYLEAGSYALTADMTSSMEFIGIGSIISDIVFSFGGFTSFYSLFRNVTFTDEVNPNTDFVYAINCEGQLSTGVYEECGGNAGASIYSPVGSTFTRCLIANIDLELSTESINFLADCTILGVVDLLSLLTVGVEIDFTNCSGRVTIDPTCTDGIVRVIGGDLVLTNLAMPGTIQVFDQSATTETAWKGLDRVFLNDVNGTNLGVNGWVAGYSPVGLPNTPVNNLTDALAIMAARGLSKLELVGNSGSITFTADATITLIGNPLYDIIVADTVTLVSFIGDLVCGSLNNGIGTTDIYGDIITDRITCSGIGTINVYGNTSCSSIFSISGGGALEIQGNLDAPYVELCLDASNLGVGGDCICSGIRGVGAVAITILKDLISISDAVVTLPEGLLEVYGDTSCYGLDIGAAGILTIIGDLEDRGVLSIAAGGIVNVNGVAHIHGAITNLGTLTYRGVYPEIAVNVTAIVAGVDIFHLNTATYHYNVDSLYLKCGDPGIDTVTIQLWKLINGVLTQVGSFDITQAGVNPFTEYYSLMDMFGVDHLSGDELQVIAVASANSYAVTGSFCYQSR